MDEKKDIKLSYYEKNKELIKQRARDKYNKNKELIKERARQKYGENSELIKGRRRELYHTKNWEYKQEYYKANLDTIKTKQKAYYESGNKSPYDPNLYITNKDKYKKRYLDNKEHLNEIQRMRHNYLYKHNEQFRIKCLLRSYINSCILWDSNNDDFQYLTGMFLPLFKQYLEYEFEPGMSWDNRKAWHIDHIIPTTQFDLTQLADILKCYNYGNLVPRWSKDNLNKAASINKLP